MRIFARSKMDVSRNPSMLLLFCGLLCSCLPLVADASGSVPVGFLLVSTESPSALAVVLPTTSPTIAPLEEFASLTSKPSSKPIISSPTFQPTADFLPPPTGPSSEIPPLDIHVEDPLQEDNLQITDAEDGLSIEHNDGNGIDSLNGGADSRQRDASSTRMSTKDTWLVSLLVILIFSIIVWGWCRCREAKWNLENEDSFSDSIHSNSAGEPEVPEADRTLIIGIDHDHTPIKENRTGSTDASENSPVCSDPPSEVESRKDRREKLSGDIATEVVDLPLGHVQEHEIVPDVEDFIDDIDLENQSYPTQSEDTTFLPTNQSAYTCESEEIGFGNDFSSILDYPVPNNCHDGSQQIEDEDMNSNSGMSFQLSQASLLLNPSAVGEDSQLFMGQGEQQSLCDHRPSANFVSLADMTSKDLESEADEDSVQQLSTRDSSNVQESPCAMEMLEVMEVGDSFLTSRANHSDDDDDDTQASIESCGFLSRSVNTSKLNASSGSDLRSVPKSTDTLTSHDGNDSNDKGSEMPSPSVSKAANDCDKSLEESQIDNEETNGDILTAAGTDVSLNSVESSLFQQQTTNNISQVTPQTDYPHTPFSPAPLQSKSYSVSKTYTGATVSPTPEKSICGESYGRDEKEMSSSLQESPSDEILAAQRLFYGNDEEESDTSLYSC